MGFSGGAEIGSTRVIKAIVCIRHGTAVTGPRQLNANDNTQFVAVNDNFVVREAIAA